MKVFVTGGTGFVGSRVIRLLFADSHEVSALSRRTGTELDKLNVKIIQSVTDLDSVASAAADAEAVMHLAFGHDFTKYQEAIEQDTAVIQTAGTAMQWQAFREYMHHLGHGRYEAGHSQGDRIYKPRSRSFGNRSAGGKQGHSARCIAVLRTS